MKSDDSLKQAEALFAALEAEFAHLRGALIHTPGGAVDLALECEAPPELPFPVTASLQGDELCLQVGGAFWCEWFPSSEAAAVAEYADVVPGVLSGEIRLVEFHCGGRAVKAELQRRENGSWRILARWRTAHLPSLAPTETRVLQKVRAANS